MARRAGGATIIGPEKVTAEQQDSDRQRMLEGLRAQAAQGQAEYDQMEEELGPVEGPSLLETPVDRLGVAGTQAPTAIPEVTPEVTPEAQVGVEPEVDPLQQRQVELEHQPGLFSRTGLAQDFSNIDEVFGTDMTNRLRFFNTRLTQDLDPVQYPLRKAIESEHLGGIQEGFNKGDFLLDQFNDNDTSTPMKMDKGKNPLALTKANVLMSQRGLGIAEWNPKWNPKEAELDAQGRVLNYEKMDDKGNFELSTTQPVRISPVYGVALASTIEPYLLRTEAMEFEAEVEQDEQGARAEDLQQAMSMEGLGREIFKGVRGFKAELQGQPTEDVNADYDNLTPEAFEMIGKWAMETYAQANPEMLTIIPGKKDGDSATARGYALTQEGLYTLQREVERYQPVDFDYSLMVEKSPTGRHQYGQKGSRAASGQQPKTDTTKVDEAKLNAHSVDVVFDNQRSKIAVMMGAHALATNPIASRGGDNFTHNAFDMGRDRMDKILATVTKQQAILARLEAELEDVKSQLAVNDFPWLADKSWQLQEEIHVVKERIKKFSDKEVQRRSYFQHTNKYLEALVNLSKYNGETFHYSYFNQRSTNRLTTHQHKLSFQNNHLIRNVVGSGVKYEIQARSGSKNETAFVENLGYLFFDGGGYRPEVAQKRARAHIKNKSARYKQLVSIGGKIKNALDNFDPSKTNKELAGVKVTPKGIIGIDGISETIPASLMEDTEVKSFLETLSSDDVKGTHKHFVQVLDYLVDLAKYDEAVKSGKSFHSSVNAVEVDGISNGLASIIASLGLKNKLYSVGVLRARGQEKNLGAWQHIPNRDAFEGDLRDILAENIGEAMNGELGGALLFDSAMMRKYGYTEEAIPALRDMIKIAVSDKANFLKPPLMTFAYGQELSNLIGSVYDTVVDPSKKNQELKTSLEKFFPGGLAKGVEFLSEFRNAALELTLGEDVLDFTTSVKNFVEVSTMYNRPVELHSESGGTVSFGGFITKVDTEKESYSFVPAEPLFEGRRATKKSLEKALAATGNPTRKALIQKRLDNLPKQVKAKVTPKYKEFSPLAPKGGLVGGKARGGILIAFGQGSDGATIVDLYSGRTWDKLVREGGGKTPFILPIYDAIVTDLGSMNASRKAINNSWFDITTSGRVLNSLEKNVTGNVHFGRKEFRKLAETEGNSPIDMEEHGLLVEWVANKLVRLKNLPKEDTRGQTLKRELLENPTYGNLFAAQEFLLKNEYGVTRNSDGVLVDEDIRTQVAKLVRKANERSRKVAHELMKDREAFGTDAEILQYHSDDLGLGDFLSAYDE